MFREDSPHRVDARGGKPLDFSDAQTWSVRDRKGRVSANHLARVPAIHQSLDSFLDTLPHNATARKLIDVAEHLVVAAANDRRVIWMIGPRAIEAGLSRLIVDLMEKRIIQCVALNGMAAVHDFELACFGHAFEDVEEAVRDGSLGMARETGEWMNELINDGVRRGFGIGYALGRGIIDRGARFREVSILANAVGQRVPVTVHVAPGADTIHTHPSADGALLGKGTYKDFQILAGQLEELDQGGVVVNCGSTLSLPEIFIKALSIARNLGQRIDQFVTVQFNDPPGGRNPAERVLSRAARPSGRAISVDGPIEIMMPLLSAAVQRLVH